MVIYENHLRPTNKGEDDYFVLRGVEITISDLTDIENLDMEEKYFLFDEDKESF